MNGGLLGGLGGFLLIAAVVQAQIALFLDQNECGKTKQCVGMPENCSSVKDCTTYVAFKPTADGERLEFELWAPGEFSYIALGFSRDTRMGDDAVTYCYSLSTGKGVGMGKNVGTRFIPNEDEAAVKGQVEMVKTRKEEGQFYCRFTQKINRGASGDLFIPDLSAGVYHLLSVRGEARSGSGRPTPHGLEGNEAPFQSAALSLVAAPKGAGGNTSGGSVAADADAEPKAAADDKPSRLWMKLHGALMLLAWLGLVFCAVFAARYTREHWPNSTVGGLQIWFQIHRTLNVASVVLVVIAAFCIYFYKGFEWTGPSVGQDAEANTRPNAIHSLLGAITVLLALSQPLIALLRCAKDDPKRPIFNYVHRSLGLLAILLAVITIGYAIFGQFFRWKHLQVVQVVFVVFLVLAVLLVLLQEVLRIQDRRSQQKVTAIEMRSRGKNGGGHPSDGYYYQNHQSHSTRYRFITSIIYAIFALFALTAAIVLAVLVFKA